MAMASCWCGCHAGMCLSCLAYGWNDYDHRSDHLSRIHECLWSNYREICVTFIYMGIMCTHHVHLCRHRHSARATNHCSRVINRGVSYNRATTLCTAGDGVMVAERNMGSVEDISNHPSHEWLPLLTSAIVNHCMNHYQHLSTIIDHYSQWFTVVTNLRYYYEL